MQDIALNILTSSSSRDKALSNTQVDEYYYDLTPEGKVSVNVALTENPYPGLRPFKTNESVVFFGREGISAILMERIAQQRFLAILGSSGTGKSSLVRAGLLPALNNLPGKHGCWKTIIFRPGRNPFGNLARAVHKAGVAPDFDELDIWRIVSSSSFGFEKLYGSGNIHREYNTLIIVDQFEELFRYKSDNGINGLNEAALFVKMLIDISKQESNSRLHIYVLITMRSEFLGDCVQLPGLVEIINEGQFLVPRLTSAQLKTAIDEPAEFSGSCIKEGVADTLAGEIGDNMDQLPVLQHALRKSYEHAKKRAASQDSILVTYEDYSAIGRMETALDEQATEIFDGLATHPTQQKYCEILFKGLADRATDGKGVRRPLPFSTILAICKEYERKNTDEAEIRKNLKMVVDQFRSDNVNFIMPPSQAEISEDTELDISHESLMRVWHHLKVWMVEEAEDARLLKELLARDPDDFFKLDKLTIYKDWVNRKRPGITWAKLYKPAETDEQVFLDKFNDRIALIDRSRIKHRNTLLLKMGGIMASLVLIVIFFRAIANSTAMARSLPLARTEMIALTKEYFYQSNNAAFLTKRDIYIDSLIKLEYEIKDLPQRNSLLAGLNWTAHACDVADQDPNLAFWMAKRAYAHCKNKWIDSLLTTVLNRYCFYVQKNLFIDDDIINSCLVALSNDHKQIAVKIGDTIRLGAFTGNGINFVKDLHPGEPLTYTLSGIDNSSRTDPLSSLAFTDDHHLICFINGYVYEWDMSGNKEISSEPVLGGMRYSSSALSPDGRKLAVNYKSGNIKVLDLKDRRPFTIENRKYKIGNVSKLSFSPNSDLLLVEYNEGDSSIKKYKVVDMVSRKATPAILGAVSYAGFTPNGHAILAKVDKGIALFDVQGNPLGLETLTLPIGEEVNKLVLSPDWTGLFVRSSSSYAYSRGYFYQGYKGNKADSIFHLDTGLNEHANWSMQELSSSLLSSDIIMLDSIHLVSTSYNYDSCLVYLWKSHPHFANLQDAFSALTAIPPLPISDGLTYNLINADTLKGERDIGEAARYFYATFLQKGMIDSAYSLRSANVLYAKLLAVDPSNKRYLARFKMIGGYLFSYDSNYTAISNNLKKIVQIEEGFASTYTDTSSPQYKAYIHALSIEYGNLSYFTIMDTINKDYTAALWFANRGLALDSTNSFIRTNLALGYLLSNQFGQATAIYTTYRDQWYSNRYKPYKVAFLEDLAALRRHKIIDERHPVVLKEAKKIENYLQDDR